MTEHQQIIATSPLADGLANGQFSSPVSHATSGGLVRRTIFDLTDNELSRMKLLSQMFAVSSFNSGNKNKPPMKEGDAFLVMLKGLEVGMNPMAAVKLIDIIDGQPAMRVQGMLALIRGTLVNGKSILEDMKLESLPDRSIVTMKRLGQPTPITVTYTWEDAVKAGLAEKWNWKKQPSVMMDNRAISKANRLLFSDIIEGIYPHEELNPDIEIDEDGNVISWGGQAKASNTPKPKSEAPQVPAPQTTPETAPQPATSAPTEAPPSPAPTSQPEADPAPPTRKTYKHPNVRRLVDNPEEWDWTNDEKKKMAFMEQCVELGLGETVIDAWEYIRGRLEPSGRVLNKLNESKLDYNAALGRVRKLADELKAQVGAPASKSNPFLQQEAAWTDEQVLEFDLLYEEMFGARPSSDFAPHLERPLKKHKSVVAALNAALNVAIRQGWDVRTKLVEYKGNHVLFHFEKGVMIPDERGIPVPFKMFGGRSKITEMLGEAFAAANDVANWESNKLYPVTPAIWLSGLELQTPGSGNPYLKPAAIRVDETAIEEIPY